MRFRYVLQLYRRGHQKRYKHWKNIASLIIVHKIPLTYFLHSLLQICHQHISTFCHISVYISIQRLQNPKFKYAWNFVNFEYVVLTQLAQLAFNVYFRLIYIKYFLLFYLFIISFEEKYYEFFVNQFSLTVVK